jgi:hypothetical protein
MTNTDEATPGLTNKNLKNKNKNVPQSPYFEETKV